MKLSKRLSIRWRLRNLIHKEIDKIEEAEEKNEEINTDKLSKLMNLKSGSKTTFERIWTVTRDVAGIVVPLWFYGRWIDKGLKFEETGVLCSGTFKSFTSKLKPNKM